MPFLLFNRNPTESMEFYSPCFGGDLILTRLADTTICICSAPQQTKSPAQVDAATPAPPG
jgi:hypothetical protein